MSENALKKCPSCGKALQFSVQIDFKIRGNSGLGLLEGLFQESPKTEEGVLPLSLFVCPECGSTQFFACDEIKKSLLTLAEADRILTEAGVLAEKRIRKKFPDFDKESKASSSRPAK